MADRRHPHPRPRRAARVRGLLSSLRLRAGLALGTVLAVGATGTFAYWSDTVEVSGVTITSGTLDLQVNGADTISNYTALDLNNMMPGNSTAGVMTVSNAGTVPLTYFVNSSATNSLGSALVVKVTGDAAVTGSGASETCAGSALPNTGSGFGSNLVGSDADQRRLEPGASETLCVQATLPATAPNGLQGTTTAVTFSYNAQQVPG